MSFYVKRLVIPFVILMIASLFPDINTILSLVAGSICGVLLIVLPVFFYRGAYIDKPSKKDRTCTIIFGYLIVLIALPIGAFGVYHNIKVMMGKGHSDGLEQA